MTVISLCDVIVRRRSSLSFSEADPTASLPQVELDEADPGPTGSMSRNNRYARKIRNAGTDSTTRQAVDPTTSLHQVESTEASPFTRITSTPSEPVKPSKTSPSRSGVTR